MSRADDFIQSMLNMNSGYCTGCPFFSFENYDLLKKCYYIKGDVMEKYTAAFRDRAQNMQTPPCKVVQVLYAEFLSLFPEPVVETNDGIIRRIQVDPD